jgi:transmembrane sensor
MDHSEFNIENLLTSESFINFCYGTNKTDVQLWEDKIVANPDASGNIEQARELCLLLAVKVSPGEKQIQLDKLKQQIEQAGVLQIEKKTIGTKVKQLWIWASVAASFLLFTTIYIAHYRASQSTASAMYSHINNSNYRLTAQTDFNHRKTVVLPDGSTVIMNGSSTLKVAADFNIKNRHVLLTGEAFFLVKKNHAKPFVVFTDKTATTALGTSFKVQSYPAETVASVMLSTGKVKVESTKTNTIDEVILTPGQQAVLANNKTAFVKSGFDNLSIQNWLNRKLVFANSDLTDITRKFKEIYGINLITSKISPDKVMFTGQFNDQNPIEVLEAIGFSNHFTYTQSGNNITLIF